MQVQAEVASCQYDVSGRPLHCFLRNGNPPEVYPCPLINNFNMHAETHGTQLRSITEGLNGQVWVWVCTFLEEAVLKRQQRLNMMGVWICKWAWMLRTIHSQSDDVDQLDISLGILAHLHVNFSTRSTPLQPVSQKCCLVTHHWKFGPAVQPPLVWYRRVCSALAAGSQESRCTLVIWHGQVCGSRANAQRSADRTHVSIMRRTCYPLCCSLRLPA